MTKEFPGYLGNKTKARNSVISRSLSTWRERAGKHWTEEEVKALLSVWAEKNIQKQFYGTFTSKYC